MFKHFEFPTYSIWTYPLVLHERTTIGHTRKYCTENATHHTSISRFDFLPNRIAAWWNELPDLVVNATSVNVFKNTYDTAYVKPPD